ncbi:MAG TPA: tRNA (N(6)-L-threonylcarbamoyladenosine(37)-C(2))-methylthiotransferase MtaB [Vicinamibacterales bacterium]|nr:tRNA (N(6)-L-threonylcarbamoyladenosine(37)-C(2))-methylthiotransferase MtaB [Vicinamibacterales bacterium]
MRYAVVTFGCRVNQADSLSFEEELIAAGATAAPAEAADLVVVNTCSVTATADQGARQTIRRIARDNPAARIIVTGCYATRRPEEIAALPNVAQIVCNDDKPKLIPLISLTSAASVAEASSSGDGPCGAAIEPGIAGRTAFTLRVQTGCAESCSYCIIPSTRGAPRSVPLAHLLREVQRVVSAGFKEIALTGVHLGSWGRDFVPRSSLVELLQALDRAPASRERRVVFRISSLEPMDCSREIVDLVAWSDCYAPHFHLPLQHASDRVLAAMRRPYTIEYYMRLVDGIRAMIPDAAIGTDVIVGFPGETNDDFEQLATYLEHSPLTHVHVFPYSDRPGTVASTLGDRASGATVRERARRVREIGQRLAQRFRDSQIGTTHRALTLEDGSLVVTGNYLKVRIPPGHARNEWVRVGIRSHDQGELLAG